MGVGDETRRWNAHLEGRVQLVDIDGAALVEVNQVVAEAQVARLLLGEAGFDGLRETYTSR